jgi:hypothetical protein
MPLSRFRRRTSVLKRPARAPSADPKNRVAETNPGNLEMPNKEMPE